jgi:type II secretory pathway component GspD/PulD (secretin)
MTHYEPLLPEQQGSHLRYSTLPRIFFRQQEVGGGGGGAQGGGGGGAHGGGGGGAQGGGGGGAQGGGGGGAQGGGGGGAQGGGGGNAFSRAGFSILANLVTGNLVMQGTPEQLEMAEKIAKEIDVRRPQMMIEVALIELSKSSTKVFDVTPTGSFGLGEFRLGLLGKNYNVAAGNGYGGTGGGLRVPSIDVSFAETLSKGKVLANPTIVALDGTSSSINITDSIVYFQTQTNVAAGVSTTTVTPQTQQVGIQLSLTPQMTNDGMVTLTLNPTVTQLLGIISGPGGTTSPQVASRTLSIAQVRVRDGETLVLGGLVRDVRTENLRKVPGLADLPIVGAFFRTTGATGNVNSRTELVMMVTPHILKDTETSYFAHQNTPSVPTPKVNAGENGLITPSPMPHFTPEQLPALSKNAFVETGRFQLPNGSKARSSAANVKPMSKMLPYAMPTKSSTASRGPAPALRGAAAGLEAPLANPFVAPASTSASTSASSAASPALPPTP